MKSTNLNHVQSSKRGMGSIQVVLGVTVTVLVVGIVAIPLLVGVNTTGWDSTTVTIYGIIPTFLLLGAGVMLVIRHFF